MQPAALALCARSHAQQCHLLGRYEFVPLSGPQDRPELQQDAERFLASFKKRKLSADTPPEVEAVPISKTSGGSLAQALQQQKQVSGISCHAGSTCAALDSVPGDCCRRCRSELSMRSSGRLPQKLLRRL